MPTNTYIKTYTTAYVKIYEKEEDLKANNFKLFYCDDIVEISGESCSEEDIVKYDSTITCFYEDEKSPFLLEIWAEDEQRVGLEHLAYSQRKDNESEKYTIINNREDLNIEYIEYE